MSPRTITVILGAGASKAYERQPYPLLNELLSAILDYADRLPGIGGRQRLYLAYALGKCYGIDTSELDTALVSATVIQNYFEHVKSIQYESIEKVFKKLDESNETRAYWALSNAIGIHVFQMMEQDINHHCYSHTDASHKKLVLLLDKLLRADYTINVVTTCAI